MNLGGMVLADLSLGIGAGGVEIAKRHGVDAVCALEVWKGTLDGELGFPIRVDGSLRMRLGDRGFHRFAVRGAR
jgi:hypothetical protein